MNIQKGSITILVIIAAIIAFLGGTSYSLVTKQWGYSFNNPLSFFKTSDITQISCTQEAKQCPNGLYVSRSGPRCEFADCPAIAPTEKPNTTVKPCPDETTLSSDGTCQLIPGTNTITLGEGQRDSHLLVQKIYPDYITGLNSMGFPVAVEPGRPITLYINQSVSNGCTVTLTLIGIQGNTAIFTKKVIPIPEYGCPKCLAKNTMINTPNGLIPVEQLAEGMDVWTTDASGNRVAGIITRASKTLAPPNHRMVHITLDDGREIFASHGHPLGDGRTFGNLIAGELLNGGYIAVSENIAYQEDYTYDILPSGDTGFYWANGILIDSTLH
ncbi:MAG: hypothetical protein A3D44_01830 [Candidatus Staskawiczbacteria bacterium RIFCSPHIGHO2_02_FULL_42_22]|uniref:Hint domain-containing protein n=1 Tax=Candidatus Staskawiczbacteria bacterium RIFCSPHIGHO2_02_FULL_42_22 TaxID=1802207 RepID=A0A1G2I2V1_9BACT|nr:MAG: hypothetical protein A3D44_01830 [Candidatus Staskawiczbacteria bacterium RIFCSPHIGHO2_02_FULL_42_22]